MSVHLKKRIEIIRRGRNRKIRPKTFKNEAAAKAYAEANKIANFEIKNLKNEECKSQKLVIVQK